jgi:hypothetical protein
MKVLITGASLAKAHQLKNSLDGAEVVLGDYMDLPAFMLSSGNMMNLPDPKSASYTHEMLTLCLDNGIDFVHVLRVQEADQLFKASQLFDEYNITLKDEVH